MPRGKRKTREDKDEKPEFESLVKKSRNLVLENVASSKHNIKSEIKTENSDSSESITTKKSTKFVGKVPVNMAEEDTKGSFSAYGGIKKFKVVIT